MKQNATLDSSFWINVYRAGLHSQVLDRFQLNYGPAVAAELWESFPAGREFWGLVRQGVLSEAHPAFDVVQEFGPGGQDAINLALEHRDWILLIDDRKPLLEAERRGLVVLCSPVLVVDLYSEGRLDIRQALNALAGLTAMQTVSPTLLGPAVAHLNAMWGGHEGQ
ncbi:MAG: hypothetical protein QF672_17025 [SAR202 cluster bacterium]|nr:hypothetical protein [SAR202 cluster bacterium]